MGKNYTYTNWFYIHKFLTKHGLYKLADYIYHNTTFYKYKNSND